jgi:predicted metalloprotease with PDZ domain
VKGAVIGFLLDAHIRRMTAGAKALDDVMRLMRSRFSGEKGFLREDVRAVVAEVAGPTHARDIRAWMVRALETTAELEHADALAWLGLRMTPPPSAPRAYLGVTTRTENGKTIITGIRRGSPAAGAGLSLLDEISAINGEPLEAGQLVQRLERLSPGSKVTLAIVRRNDTRTPDIVLATDPGHGWQFSVSPGATRAQSQQLDAWLGQQ